MWADNHKHTIHILKTAGSYRLRYVIRFRYVVVKWIWTLVSLTWSSIYNVIRNVSVQQ